MVKPKRAAALKVKENLALLLADDDTDFQPSDAAKSRKRRNSTPLRSKTNDQTDTAASASRRQAKKRQTVEFCSVKTESSNNSVSLNSMTLVESTVLSESLTLEQTAGCPIVYFDLETTGIGRDCEITQIGACNGTRKYSRYCFPERGIAPFVQKLTGITVIGRQMYYKKKEVESLKAKDGMLEFLRWLQMISEGSPVILVAHNAKSFDARVLIQVAHEHKLLDDLQKTVIGFSDTLLLFRSKFPRSQNFKLKTLVQQHCNGSFAWHNAMADVNAMIKLCEATKVSRKELIDHSFSTDFTCRVFEFSPLIDDGCFQKEMARRLVAGRLSVADLKQAAIAGYENLEKLLSGVTAHALTIQRIHGYFYTEKFAAEDFIVNEELERSLTQTETEMVQKAETKAASDVVHSVQITTLKADNVKIVQTSESVQEKVPATKTNAATETSHLVKTTAIKTDGDILVNKTTIDSAKVDSVQFENIQTKLVQKPQNGSAKLLKSTSVTTLKTGAKTVQTSESTNTSATCKGGQKQIRVYVKKPNSTVASAPTRQTRTATDRVPIPVIVRVDSTATNPVVILKRL